MKTIALAAVALSLLAGVANAQDWPSQPIKIVVPFAAGGSTDALGRILAEGLTARLGQQVYVENQAGNSGAIGSEAVAASDPDGYTLLISGVGSHISAPLVNANITYDPIEDFTHIAMLGGAGSVLTAIPSMEVSSLEELVELGKTRDQEITWASPGAGSFGHMLGEYFAQQAGIKMRHISYRGAAPALTDMLGGHVEVGLLTYLSVSEQVANGDLIALATTAPERSAAFPDVPTITESGYENISGIAWFAVSGPAGMPDEIVERLNAEVRDILKAPETAASLAASGSIIPDLTAAETTAYYVDEVNRWTEIYKSIDLKME